ncbi:DNA repair protein [Streptomyces sp. 150FB]|uniref:non-homologous end joining protein Ku n=1 Tax=Streptomyces sp. 150FB TaxID=1576605 RepID=UPI0005890FD1|nr:Ku protein [Streptomyces sp. 150FB]KIF72727.1 DNA repair protein [Streptomyces sp. 150FB]
MPTSIWSGAISFGLVTISVRLTPASENHSIGFHRIHLEDGGRVRNRKVCEIEDREVSEGEIGKGYELTKDRLIEVTDDELAQMPLPTARAIEIVAFVDRETIDPVRLGTSYYLEAAGDVAAKPYTLLRAALERSEKVAIAKYALRGRERLGVLSIRDRALVLHQMHWPDEIRDPSSLAPPQVDLEEGEIERAIQLMESMAAEDTSGYRDRYQEAVEAMIEAKLEGREPAPPTDQEQPRGGQVVDLMAALEESVQAAREGRGEHGGDGTDATVHDLPKASAKKTAAKKQTTAAKKTAAKKTPAKKQAKKTSRHRSA